MTKKHTKKDLLEVTAHMACLIGQSWDELYQGDRVETRLMAITLATDFLDSYHDDGDEWLTPIEEFFETHALNKCECCDGKGYLEVTHDDGEYIEACQECDYFGIIGDDLDEMAQDKAKNEGYKLTKRGKIKGV